MKAAAALAVVAVGGVALNNVESFTIVQPSVRSGPSSLPRNRRFIKNPSTKLASSNIDTSSPYYTDVGSTAATQYFEHLAASNSGNYPMDHTALQQTPSEFMEQMGTIGATYYADDVLNANNGNIVAGEGMTIDRLTSVLEDIATTIASSDVSSSSSEFWDMEFTDKHGNKMTANSLLDIYKSIGTADDGRAGGTLFGELSARLDEIVAQTSESLNKAAATSASVTSATTTQLAADASSSPKSDNADESVQAFDTIIGKVDGMVGQATNSLVTTSESTVNKLMNGAVAATAVASASPQPSNAADVANEAFSTFSSKVDNLLESLAKATDLIDNKLASFDGATNNEAFNAVSERLDFLLAESDTSLEQASEMLKAGAADAVYKTDAFIALSSKLDDLVSQTNDSFEWASALLATVGSAAAMSQPVVESKLLVTEATTSPPSIELEQAVSSSADMSTMEPTTSLLTDSSNVQMADISPVETVDPMSITPDSPGVAESVSIVGDLQVKEVLPVESNIPSASEAINSMDNLAESVKTTMSDLNSESLATIGDSAKVSEQTTMPSLSDLDYDSLVSGFADKAKEASDAVKGDNLEQIGEAIKAGTAQAVDNVAGVVGSSISGTVSSYQQDINNIQAYMKAYMKASTDQALGAVNGAIDSVNSRVAESTSSAISDVQTTLEPTIRSLLGFLDTTISILVAVPRAVIEGVTGQPIEQVLVPIVQARNQLLAWMVSALNNFGQMSAVEIANFLSTFLQKTIMAFAGVTRVIIETVSGMPLHDLLNTDISNGVLSFPAKFIIVLIGVFRAFVEAVSGGLAADALENASVAVMSFMEDSLPLMFEALIALLQNLAMVLAENGAAALGL